MSDKKILVTGGAGYIGSQAVKLLLSGGYQVVVFDNLSRGYQEVIKVLGKEFSGLDFVKGDLRNSSDIAKVFEDFSIEAVLHFAALCLVDESMDKPGDYFENNVLGTLNLLRAMNKGGVKKLVFSSTCAVYGENQYLPIDEAHPTCPTNPYGESKLMAEKEIDWFTRLFDLKTVIFRYFNVAGADDEGLIGDTGKQLLVQNAVRGALGLKPFHLTCSEVDTPDKTPIRDYVNVVDLASAHILALDYLAQAKPGSLEVFNLGTGQGNSVLEIVDQIRKITGVSFPIEKGKARRGEYAALWANIDKVKKELGWSPERTLEQTVASLVSWYKSHPNGWSH